MVKDKGQVADPKDADPKDQTPEVDATPELKPGDQTPEPDTLPEEFQGKTQVELAKMLQDSQKELGSRAKELGDIKSNLAYSEQLRELERRRVGDTGTQPTTEVPEPKVDWSYENPVESAREVFKQELEKDKQVRQKDDLERIQDEAKSNYAEGRHLAMSRNPKLFEGIEREAEDAVYKAYMGRVIKIHSLRDPNAWEMAAKLIHLSKGDIDRLKSAGIKPVTSTSTELPTPERPGSAEKSFTGLDYSDEETQKMVKQYGLTKEEAEEVVKDEQERIARGGK